MNIKIKLIRKFTVLVVLLISGILVVPADNVQAKYPCDWLCRLIRDECIDECANQGHQCVAQCQADFIQCHSESCP